VLANPRTAGDVFVMEKDDKKFLAMSKTGTKGYMPVVEYEEAMTAGKAMKVAKRAEAREVT